MLHLLLLACATPETTSIYSILRNQASQAAGALQEASVLRAVAVSSGADFDDSADVFRQEGIGEESFVQRQQAEDATEATEAAAVGEAMEVDKNELRIWLSCSNLPSQIGDKIDPYLRAHKPGGWHKDTDTIDDEANPVFKPLTLPFDFTQLEPVTFELRDEDTVSSDDKIGYFRVKLGEIYFASRDGEPQVFELTKEPSGGGQIVQSHGAPSTCTIHRAVIPVDEELTLTFHGLKLAAKDGYGVFRSSDPYLKLFLDQSQSEVLKTNTLTRNVNPVWDPEAVKVEKVGNGDWNVDLFVSVWDKDVGADDLIGECEFKAVNLLFPPDGANLCELAKAGKTGSQGTIGLTASFGKKPMVLGDYLAAGVELDFTVAIDLTASNINQGLHNGGANSPYGIAIQQLGSVVEQYDTDKQYGLYTFGALTDGSNPAQSGNLQGLPGFSDDFKVDTNAWSRGMGKNTAALVESYVNLIARCDTVMVPYRQSNGQMSTQKGCYYGPTNYAAVIQAAMVDLREAMGPAKAQGRHIYKVLVILTDGVPSHDGKVQTMKDLIRAAELPMSVVFIGIGEGEANGQGFKALEAFDGDQGYEEWPRSAGASGKGPSRDIVQFVDYPESDPASLSRETLKEVPKQMIDAFLGKGIPPFNLLELAGRRHEMPLQVVGKPEYAGITTYVENRRPAGITRD